MQKTGSALTSRQKAAILLVSLDKEYAAQLYKYLTDEEISELTLGIAALGRISSETREQVVGEFYEMCLARKFIGDGGIDYARDILEKALGRDRADSLILKLTSSLQTRPFDFFRRADTMQIINLIQNEHPQTIALIMSYIDAKQAASVLMAIPQRLQSNVIERIAKMGGASAEYVRSAERILESKLASTGFAEQSAPGGIDTIVDIINSFDRSTEKNVLESLEVSDAELADEIKKRLFVFEDIAKLSNQAIARVLREISNSDLAVALKLSTDEVRRAVFSNISKRLQEMIKDDMEVMGPVRVRDVEEAQQRIVNIIRRLEEEGEIIIARGDSDVFVA